MLIRFGDLIETHRLDVTGVLHVGAHLGEEADAYHECGVDNVVWVEANPALIHDLRQNVERYGHRVIQACVSDSSGARVPFHVTNNGQSSSLLEFGTHRRVSPDVYFVEDIEVTTTTIDDLATAEHFAGLNFLNMDLQGAELLALRGAEQTLGQIDAAYLEVNVDELYLGCARLPQLDEFLAGHGFRRVEMVLAGDQKRGGRNWTGWGDGLWIR